MKHFITTILIGAGILLSGATALYVLGGGEAESIQPALLATEWSNRAVTEPR
ncbi:hypothetical protein [Nocardia sp. NPDC052566]|uniref:hypothetical protein n=1 Tax=Nocardia sp. NPDC052566 TaxID=3364330 RepID=UPI0037C649DA